VTVKVVITGATGNVGTSVLAALETETAVEEIVAVARRAPGRPFSRARFVAADIVRDDLAPVFAGADAVVHLAWLIQPGRDESVTRAVNVTGTERVIAAAVAAGVGALVHASSVGTYSPGPKDRAVDESWPTRGIPTSFYSRHKAACERLLDQLEHDQPALRVVRMRPGLIFKREAATEIRRLFAGPFLPGNLVRRELIPILPYTDRLRVQAVHSLDVGDAYRRAVVSDARGAFNVAAEPPLGPAEFGEVLGARPVRVPAPALRAAAAATFALRLQPTEPGWLDMGLGVPIMDCTRVRTELGWEATRSAPEALAELLGGMQDGADFDTPPLARSTTGPGRVRELLTGVGGRV
jgi:nucleoside-diphosphate-sugar epimerase